MFSLSLDKMAELVKEDVDLDEGTWHLPKGVHLKGLKKLLTKPLKLGKDGDNAIEAIGNFIGDDELFDDLYVDGKKDSNGDARPAIRKAMKRLGIKEEVELDEAPAKVWHLANKKFNLISDKDGYTLVKQGSGEEKKLKAKTPADATAELVKKGYRESVEFDEASAYADARRAMKKDKDFSRKDTADDDDSASADDVKAASKNIMMQLRKSISLRGAMKVEFGDKKKVKVSPKIAAAAATKYNSLRRPADKEKFQAQIAKSYKDLLKGIKEETMKESKFSFINKQLKGEK